MLDKLITLYHQNLFDFCLLMALLSCLGIIMALLIKLYFELGKLSSDRKKFK